MYLYEVSILMANFYRSPHFRVGSGDPAMPDRERSQSCHFHVEQYPDLAPPNVRITIIIPVPPQNAGKYCHLVIEQNMTGLPIT